MFNWFSKAHHGEVLNGLFEAVIVIIGETGAGKSRLINLIAGEPITGTGTPKSANIQEYTCTYKDKDTNHTWKLHLLDTPGFVDNYSDSYTCYAIWQRLRTMERKLSNGTSGIIYCHNINRGQLTGFASRLMHIFMDLHGNQMIKSVIFCTTQWDMLADQSVGEHRFQKLKEYHWNKTLELGARTARHDNTRTSVEEMLRLIVGQEALKLLLLRELERPQMTAASKATFKQNHDGTKQLLQEIRNTHIKEAADRAKIKGEDEDSSWQQKFARLSAELDGVKTAQERNAIEQRMDVEDQELKRKLWKAIRRATKERTERDNTEVSRRLTKPTDVTFIANPASVAHDNIGDSLTSSTTLLDRTLPEDKIGVDEQKQRYSGEVLETASGSSATRSSRINNHVVDDPNEEIRADFVPLQSKPFTNKYAIASTLASKKFQNVDLLLAALNKIFDTNIPISYRGIRKTLEYLINKEHDLGAVYAHMQVIWPTSNMPSTSSEPLADNSSDYVIASPELASSKFQDVGELLIFLNISFNTKILRSMPGIDKVLRFLVDQGCEYHCCGGTIL